MERFWRTEDLTTTDTLSLEERRCESLYQSTVSRNEDGRYIVQYPRKPDFDVMIGESRHNAQRQFEHLEKRLERNPQLKSEYHQFMKEYISLGHMRLVEADDDDAPAYYLPHHPVIKEESTTTKVRDVYNGSAKTSTGFSLNEALCVGPVVQDDLLDIILRFR